MPLGGMVFASFNLPKNLYDSLSKGIESKGGVAVAALAQTPSGSKKHSRKAHAGKQKKGVKRLALSQCPEFQTLDQDPFPQTTCPTSHTNNASTQTPNPKSTTPDLVKQTFNFPNPNPNSRCFLSCPCSYHHARHHWNLGG